jgi:hypothetical protein
MELVADLLKIIIPSSILLYGIFLIVKAFITKELEKIKLEKQLESTKLTLPIRLQAYERICLFLERISLNNLILRVNDPSFNAAQLQQRLLSEIRNEYNYNLSQQVYMSDEAWNLTKKAMEDIISTINISAEGMSNESRGIELAKNILENHIKKNSDSLDLALRFIKEEIRIVF